MSKFLRLFLSWISYCLNVHKIKKTLSEDRLKDLGFSIAHQIMLCGNCVGSQCTYYSKAVLLRNMEIGFFFRYWVGNWQKLKKFKNTKYFLRDRPGGGCEILGVLFTFMASYSCTPEILGLLNVTFFFIFLQILRMLWWHPKYS